ncbi:basic proline-rich protein-like [Phalacrocorax carbo]|uniref:basic proline-rich protein-like n=1 Tax=Phalacrocorax carbo TaxID=9209 RepID=UPI00311A54DE
MTAVGFPGPSLNQEPPQGQAREPVGLRSPRPGAVSRVRGSGPGRAQPPPPGSPRGEPASGRLRAPKPGAHPSEPPRSLPRRGKLCALLPTGGARASPPGALRPHPSYVWHAHTSPLPLQSDGAWSSRRRVQPAGTGRKGRKPPGLPRSPPPCTARAPRPWRGEQRAPLSRGLRSAVRGSERGRPAGANLDKGHFRLHVSPLQLSPSGSARLAAGRPPSRRSPRPRERDGRRLLLGSRRRPPSSPPPALSSPPPITKRTGYKQPLPAPTPQAREVSLARSLTRPPTPASRRCRPAAAAAAAAAAASSAPCRSPARSPSPQPPAAGFTLPDRAPNAAAQSASRSLPSTERRLDWMDADGAFRANQAQRGAGKGAGALSPRAGGGEGGVGELFVLALPVGAWGARVYPSHAAAPRLPGPGCPSPERSGARAREARGRGGLKLSAPSRGGGRGRRKEEVPPLCAREGAVLWERSGPRQAGRRERLPRAAWAGQSLPAAAAAPRLLLHRRAGGSPIPFAFRLSRRPPASHGATPKGSRSTLGRGKGCLQQPDPLSGRPRRSLVPQPPRPGGCVLAESLSRVA